MSIARKEVQNAEQKVAKGVKGLYDLAQQNGLIEYDPQGVAIVRLEPDQIDKLDPNIRKEFPNGLEKGITLHFFKKEGVTPYPSVSHMAQEKIKSLCDAAINLEKKVKGTDQDAFSKQVQEIYKKQNEFIAQQLKEIQKTYDEKMAIATTNGLKQKAIKQFSKSTEKLIKVVQESTMQQLYGLHKKPRGQSEAYREYFAKIKKEASHHASSDKGILTFNEQTGAFSYDEGAAVNAHHRKLNSGASNLSLVCEGSYTPSNPEEKQEATSFKTNVAYAKHASLVPISELGNSLLYPFLPEKNLDILVDTCLNAVEVLESLARLREHGQEKGGERDNTLQWNYHFLTHNIGNKDKQASTYGYTRQAMQLLDGATVREMRVEANLMNAGLAAVAGFDSSLYKKSAQRRENRKAYIRLSNTVDKMEIKADLLPKGIAEKAAELKNNLNIKKDTSNFKKEIQDAYTNAEIIQNTLKNNQKDFVQTLKAYKELRAIKGKSLTPAQKKDLKKLKNKIKSHRKNVKSLNSQLRKQTYIIEKHRKAVWQANRGANESLIKEIRNIMGDPDQQAELLEKLKGPDAEKVEQQLLTVAALMYKSYADDLYYSGEYRNPEKAGLFHAYLASYEHTLGLMTSTGCKSGNDRTWVMRALIDATAGRPLQTGNEPIAGKERPLLPEALHEKKGLTGAAQQIIEANKFSNSATPATIQDTGGSTSKVSGSKFAILESISNIGFLGKLGKFASHLMESSSSLLKQHVAQSKQGKNVQSQSASLSVESKSEREAQESISLSRPSSKSR